MNFFTKILKIATGSYSSSNQVNSTVNSYFASSNLSMTKEQLVNFNAQLNLMGLAKPPGIDNMIENFSTADSDNNGTLSYSEVQTYLANNGYTTSTTSSSTINIDSSQSKLVKTIEALLALK